MYGFFMRISNMYKKYKLYNHGFSLLELMLALGILGLITVFAVSLTHSTRNLAKTNNTRIRMKEIKRAAENYYSGHRDLPGPVGSYEVPVAANALNLEQKHRQDDWGRYFHYNTVFRPGTDSPRTEITGIEVDGKEVAAVIVSGGPDQEIDPANETSPYSTTGDDIVLAVSLADQAMAIAMNDLEVLQAKAQAFDAIFAGIDNNASGIVDDDNACVAVMGCPLSPTNDPNCGSATLDQITFYSGCEPPAITSAVAFIADFYALGTSILLDPWLNNYAWNSSPSSLQYHKFFSYGPDGALGGGDDIVP
jgi:prepilin-type N-terminal cleavage/methylation domain-containing protein